MTDTKVSSTVIEKGKKPTLEQVRAIILSEEQRYSALHSSQEAWEEWAKDGVPATLVPDGYEEFTQPLGYIVRGAAGILITDNPEFKVTPSRKGQAGEDQTSVQQMFAESEYEWANKQNGCDIGKELGKQCLLTGMMVLQGPIYDETAWGEEPKKKDKEAVEEYTARQEANHPYRYAVMRSRWCCPFEDGTGIVISYDRSVTDIKATFPDWDDKGAERNSTVKWQEYHDGAWRCYLAADVPVLGDGEDGIVPETTVPYQWRYSTFGDNTKGATPEERGIGIFSGLDKVFTQQNNLLTGFFADLGNRVYHIFKVVKNSVKIKGKGPGATYEVNKQDDVQVLDQGSTPPDFTLSLGILKDIIELNTFNREILGLGGSQTATQEGIRLSQARLPFAPFLHQVESLIAEAFVKAAYDFKDNPNLPSMPLGDGKRLQKDDIVRPMSLKCDMQPIDSDLNDRLLDAGLKLKDTLDEETIVRDFLKKDPEEVLRNKLKYSVYYDPETQTFIKEQALLLAAAKLELNKAKDLQNQIDRGQISFDVTDTMTEEGGEQAGDIVPMPEQPSVPPDQFAAGGRAQGRSIVPGSPLGTTAERASQQPLAQGGA